MAIFALDRMGSDLGPNELSKAVSGYLTRDKEAKVLLFGDGALLKRLLSGDPNFSRREIRPTEEVIPREIKPLDFLRKKQSSRYQAIDAVRNKEADCVITAGSTGGFITGATRLLRNIDGVTRAGLCVAMPTLENHPCVTRDVGANNTNEAIDLVGFAKRASLYAKEVLKRDSPRVFTLSNGEEEGKGTEEIVKAGERLREIHSVNYLGNVEARYALDGKRDVVIAPGFAGNIFLKSVEGRAKFRGKKRSDAFRHSLGTKIGYLFVRKQIKARKSSLDYKAYGGAYLLGVNGICVKSHGNANAYTFEKARDVAKKRVDSGLLEKRKNEFKHDSDNA
mgnify:FL=1